LFLNLQLSFMYLLMIHIPLVLTAALVPVAGYPLLYLPIHLVWLELIIHPTALLVFQALPDAQGLVPRRTGRAHFFSTREWVVLGLVGGVTTAFVLAGYARSLHGGGGVEHARAMALAVLALWSAFLTALLSRLRTGVARTITAMTILGTVALIQIPALARALRVQPLHRDDWLLASLGALAATLLVRTFGLGARRRS
jgi:Ca2+-transporting ATPase